METLKAALGNAPDGAGDAAEKRSRPLRNFRAPLLWILLPQLAACALCENGFALPRAACVVASGVAFALAVLGACFADGSAFPRRFGKIALDVWALALPLAAFFLAGAWWSATAPRLVDWSAFPETEAVVELEVETPFRSAGKSWSGLARVRGISEDCSALVGARVFYVFRKAETDTAPLEGTRLRMRALVRDAAGDARFAEGFRDFLRSRRVSAQATGGDRIEISDTATGFDAALSRRFAAMKAALIAKLVDPRSPREREQRALAAMLLGERSLLTREQRDDFALSGTTHIFAVSGLHVSLFAALIFAACSRARAPFWLTAAATVGVTWFYVRLTGAAPSAMRAWTMIVFLLAARLLGRPAQPLNALIASASFALWRDPSLFAEPGFRLSYAVVASIFLYGVPLGDFLSSRLRIFRYVPAASLSRARRFASALWERGCAAFAVSLGTFVAGAPFVAASFGVFTPIAVLANLALVPFLGILLSAGLVSAALFCVPGAAPLAELIWRADAALMFCAEAFAGTAAAIPADAETRFADPRLGALGGALVLLAFAVGAFSPAVRARPALRFAFPPLFLLAYLLAFAF
ncbi:MAG: ComEC/Rec2 family competence protein [Candidatus Spyradosoma sp.]